MPRPRSSDPRVVVSVSIKTSQQAYIAARADFSLSKFLQRTLDEWIAAESGKPILTAEQRRAQEDSERLPPMDLAAYMRVMREAQRMPAAASQPQEPREQEPDITG